MENTITLTKVSGKPDSTLPVGYWVRGNKVVLEPGKECLISPVHSTSLNEQFDYFRSTEVVSIEGDLITTKNSVWRVS